MRTAAQSNDTVTFMRCLNQIAAYQQHAGHDTLPSVTGLKD